MAIRRSVYVGLGGTGILAISHAKKHFEDAYGKGNIPPEIAFAAIDFDLQAQNSTDLATSMKDDFISLYSIGNPQQLYDNKAKQGKYKWMSPANAGFISEAIIDGASQVRTTGRFYCEMIQEPIIQRLRECVNQVKSIASSTDGVAYTGNVDVHIAMSLAGGTGCGSFLNVAQRLRNEYGPEINIIGYGILHSVFRAMDVSGNKTPRVVANAYSAIMDLDYLMSARPDQPRKISFNGKEQTLTKSIYDEFYVIDNETEKGKKVGHIKNLSEVVGTSLFASATDLGMLIRTGSSNTGWKNGQFNISPKWGWVQALGACTVVYKGELLAEVCSLIAADNLIQNLLNTTINGSSAAVEWAIHANIKEDETDDQMIDSIYDINPAQLGAPLVDISDTISSIRQTVGRYTNSLPGYPDDERIGQRRLEVLNSLSKKVSDIIQSENGVGNAIAFLDSLRKKVTLYRSMMDEERKESEARMPGKKETLESAYDEFEKYCNKFLAKKNHKEELLDDVKAVATDILKENIEIERRKDASSIFTALLAEINTHVTNVNDLKGKLVTLQKEYKEICDDKQNQNNSALIFEYDLSAAERSVMTFTPGEGFINGYFTALDKPLYTLDLKQELGESIISYCESLQEAKAYKEKLLVDVIDDLDDKQYAQLKKEIEDKSSRLLCLDDKGETIPTLNDISPIQAMVKNYFVSVYKRNGENCRLENDDTFVPEVGRENKTYNHTNFESMKQKMIFFRTDMAIIPYCIKSFNENLIEKEYGILLKDSMNVGSTSFNPHCDMEIFKQMRETDFKLKPEMTNEADFYWVCGHIFGWSKVKEMQYIMEKDSNGTPLKIESKEETENTKYIRCSKGKYQFWNEDSAAISLNGKWEPLGNSAQRENAYSYFKIVVLPELKNTLHDKIKHDLESQGRVVYIERVKGIIADGLADYIDRVACTDKNSLTYFGKNNGEPERFVKEWEYIEKYLITALENFK